MLAAMGRKIANMERHEALRDSSGHLRGMALALAFVAILIIRAAWAQFRNRRNSASQHTAQRPRVVRSDTKTLQANFPGATRAEVLQALSKSEGNIGKAVVELSTTDGAGSTEDKKVLKKTNTKILQANFPDASREQILGTLEANKGSLARSLVGMSVSEEIYPSQSGSAGAPQPKFFGRSDTKQLQASFPDKQRADIVQALSESDGHIGKAIVQLSTGDTIAGARGSASASNQEGRDSKPLLRKTDTQTLRASFPDKPRKEILDALAKNDGRLGSAVVDLSSS